MDLDSSWAFTFLGGIGGFVAGLFGWVGIVAGIIFLIASRYAKTAKTKAAAIVGGIVAILTGIIVTLVCWALSDLGMTTDELLKTPMVILAPGFIVTDPLLRMVAPKTTLPTGVGTDRTKDAGLILPNDNVEWVKTFFGDRCELKGTQFDPPPGKYGQQPPQSPQGIPLPNVQVMGRQPAHA
jgi:hypothetical protein